jgi:hypothetical protein
LRKHGGGAPDAAPPKAVLDTLEAILATGATEGEAFGLAAQAHGVVAVLPPLLEAMALHHRTDRYYPGRLLALLDEIALGHPGLAQEGWLRSFERVALATDLWLDGRSWVTVLPEGLKVSGHLFMGGCACWDGNIPEGVVVDGCVFTDAHPDPGVRLQDWRRLHPHGEKDSGTMDSADPS